MEKRETRGCYNCRIYNKEKGCAKDVFKLCQSKGNGDFWESKKL
jgi:hypothetical protein